MSHDQPDATGVRVVRGAPSDAELAALLAVLVARRTSAEPPLSVYETWRAGRLAALRRPGRRQPS